MNKSAFSLYVAVIAAFFLSASCHAPARNQSQNLGAHWWKQSSIYHVWVKGFCDSDGDGCGDLNGVRSKLAYIQDDAGCDTIWLSPIFECAGKGTAADFNMHGYDTTDYYAVNSLFGTEADLDSLIAACHERGMKIIFDFVPNHTSSEHPWFRDAVAGGKKRGWYVWSDTDGGENPLGGGSAWHYNADAGAYYYAPFWGGMPDLNYENPDVKKEMRNVAFHWLDKGFDGMRIDAARYLVEDGKILADSAGTHALLADFHKAVQKRYRAPKLILGEVWVEKRRGTLDDYFGTKADPELDMVTDFDQGRAMVRNVFTGIAGAPGDLHDNPKSPAGAAYAVFLCNHDEYVNRLGSVFDGDVRREKQALLLQLLRPTVPVMYYGQEIALRDMPLNGDIRHRGGMDWTEAELQKNSADSVLAACKAAAALRREYADVFASGTVTPLKPERGQCTAYTVQTGSTTLLCVFNFGQEAAYDRTFTAGESWKTARLLLSANSAEVTASLDGQKITFATLDVNAVHVFALE